jgi:hypothetical protein
LISVIPADAGIQSAAEKLDTRFREYDNSALVPEMPHSSKQHCHLMLIGGGDHFIVAH